MKKLHYYYVFIFNWGINLITKYLKLGYWNEYLTGDGVVFLFQLEDGMKRYDVKNIKMVKFYHCVNNYVNVNSHQ